MSKRGELLPAWKSWGIRVVGFLLSLAVSGAVIMLGAVGEILIEKAGSPPSSG